MFIRQFLQESSGNFSRDTLDNFLKHFYGNSFRDSYGSIFLVISLSIFLGISSATAKETLSRIYPIVSANSFGNFIKNCSNKCCRKLFWQFFFCITNSEINSGIRPTESFFRNPPRTSFVKFSENYFRNSDNNSYGNSSVSSFGFFFLKFFFLSILEISSNNLFRNFNNKGRGFSKNVGRNSIDNQFRIFIHSKSLQ